MRRFLAFLVAAAMGSAVVAVPVGAALCQDSSPAPQTQMGCCVGQDDDCGMEDCGCEVKSSPEMPDDSAVLASSVKPFHVPAIDAHQGIQFSAISALNSPVASSGQSRAPPPPDRSGHQLRAPPTPLA